MSTQTETAILTGCRCGWVGIVGSSKEAIQAWHDHALDSVGGFHERQGEMAVSMPINSPGVDGLRRNQYRTALDQRALERVEARRKFERERQVVPDGIELDESRLLNVAINALAMLTLTGLLAAGAWWVWRII